MSRYVNSYQELVEIEQTRLDILLENTTIDNLFSVLNQKNYVDYLYRYYHRKTLVDVQQMGDTILIVPKNGYITQRLIYLNPNLTGGTVVGTQAINITEQDGSIQLRDKGAVNSCSLLQFLRSLFYAFGIKVDESKVDLLALSNAVLENFEFCYNRETGKSVQLTSLSDVEIMYILEDGMTYFDEDLVQAFANKMYEAGWFEINRTWLTDIENIPLNTPIQYEVPIQKLTKEWLITVVNDAYNYALPVGDRGDLRQHIDTLWTLITENFSSDLLESENACIIEVRPKVYYYDNATIRISYSVQTDDNDNYVSFDYKYDDYLDGNYVNRLSSYNGTYGIVFYAYKDGTTNYSLQKNDNTIWLYAGKKIKEDNNTAITAESYYYTTNLFGSIRTITADGVTIIDDAKLPTGLDSLATDYPTWYERLNSWIGTGVAKVGEVLRNTLNVIEFVPLTLLPNTPTQAQSGEVTDPDVVGNVPEVVIRDLDPFPTSDDPSDDVPNPNVPDPVPSDPPPIPTPTPPVPPVDPTPSITSGKLFTVYNPTTDDINNLGGFLWGESIAGILAELFSNPMDAIISLNVIYATPSIGERRNIVLGYVKSDDITAPIVTSQYITLDCGTVRVPEYYGNATDYAPFACASIYLPFIGFRDVNINEIMGSEVNINYQIDVYTGTVYASVSTIRNGIIQVLYTYEGNCAVQIPLTGGDKFRLISGVAGMVAGFAMGSPVTAIASLAGGVVNGAVSNKQGSIGANAGAMGIKKPYIVITNTQAYDAYNYNKQYGFPANASIQLGSCKGYTRVKSVHVSNISNATNEEKQNIDTLLRQGVIIN